VWFGDPLFSIEGVGVGKEDPSGPDSILGLDLPRNLVLSSSNVSPPGLGLRQSLMAEDASTVGTEPGGIQRYFVDGNALTYSGFPYI
jgi:hypothetical protein